MKRCTLTRICNFNIKSNSYYYVLDKTRRKVKKKFAIKKNLVRIEKIISSKTM